MGNFKIDSLIEYIHSDSATIHAFELPVPEDMVVFTKDFNQIRKGDSTTPYNGLPILIDFENGNEIIDRVDRLPDLTISDIGKLVATNDDASGYQILDIKEDDLVDQNRLDNYTSNYSQANHTHEGTYYTRDEINDYVKLSSRDLLGQDILSYAFLSKINRVGRSSIINDKLFVDNFNDGGYLDTDNSIATYMSYINNGYEDVSCCNIPNSTYKESPVTLPTNIEPTYGGILVSDGTTTYLHGGILSDGSTSSQFWKLNNVTNEWVQLSGAPRLAHHTANLVNGVLYLFGGIDGNGNYRNDMWKYTNGSWSIVYVDGGEELISGGGSDNNSSLYLSGGGAGTTTWEETISGGTASVTQGTLPDNIPSPRAYHTSSTIGDLLFIHAGKDDTTIYNDLYVFDTINITWTDLTPYTTSSYAHAMTSINNLLVIHGGYTVDDEVITDNTWRIYDVAQSLWITPTLTSHIARQNHSLIVIGNVVYTVGGDNGGVYTNTEIYLNIQTLTVGIIDILNKANISQQAVAFYPPSNVITFGGIDTNGTISDTCGYTTISNLDRSYITSNSITTQENVKLTKLYIDGSLDISGNTPMEVSRDDGATWAWCNMELNNGMFSGYSEYDKALQITKLTPTIIPQDFKNTTTTLIVDTTNVSGHFDIGNANNLIGAIIYLTNGTQVRIDSISGNGSNINSILFSNTILPIGNYPIEKIVNIEHIDNIVKLAENTPMNSVVIFGVEPLFTVLSYNYLGVDSYCSIRLTSNVHVVYRPSSKKWEPIVRKVGNNWEYRNLLGEWFVSTTNTEHAALNMAYMSDNNRMLLSQLRNSKTLELTNINGLALHINNTQPIEIDSRDIMNLVLVQNATIPTGNTFRYRLYNLSDNDIYISAIRVVNR